MAANTLEFEQVERAIDPEEERVNLRRDIEDQVATWITDTGSLNVADVLEMIERTTARLRTEATTDAIDPTTNGEEITEDDALLVRMEALNAAHNDIPPEGLTPQQLDDWRFEQRMRDRLHSAESDLIVAQIRNRAGEMSDAKVAKVAERLAAEQLAVQETRDKRTLKAEKRGRAAIWAALRAPQRATDAVAFDLMARRFF